MERPVIEAKTRPSAGKGYARKVRALGYIPAVLYGRDMEPVNLAVDPKAVSKMVTSEGGMNTLVLLKLDDQPGERLALIRQYQVHPYTRKLEHCDFMCVSEDQIVKVRVPIKFVGRAQGEKWGGIQRILVREVQVRCRASQIPKAIELDVTPLGLGQEVRLSQLRPPDGVELLYRRDVPVVSIAIPRGVEAAEEGATEQGEATATSGQLNEE